MNVLDLFCGAAGGWSKGLALAGYRIVAACEIDPWRRAVFAAQHLGCRMYGDVRELTADRLEQDLGYLPDIVVGSPPCQEISAANCKGTGITDDHLFWEWARIIFEVRPLWCAAENSPRARITGIDGILDALDQAGYACWPLVVGADHAGANHRRRRLWLIAADATRIGSDGRQQQPQWGTSRRDIVGFPSGAGDDPDPDGRFAGGARRHADGCIAMGAGADGAAGADALGVGRARPVGCTEGRAQERDRPAGDALSDARHAPQFGGLRLGGSLAGCRAEPAQADLRDAPHPDREGPAIGPRLALHHGEELPAALRDIGLAWPCWNGGLAGLAAACAAAGFGAVDDGADDGLPAGLRNRAIAALGDAVLPQITYAIGKAMRAAFHGAEETP